LAEGAEAIGLVVMLQDLIVQNIEQNSHKLADFKLYKILCGKLSVRPAGVISM